MSGLMSAFGTKRTSRESVTMSAFGGKAELVGDAAMSACDPKWTSADTCLATAELRFRSNSIAGILATILQFKRFRVDVAFTDRTP